MVSQQDGCTVPPPPPPPSFACWLHGALFLWYYSIGSGPYFVPVILQYMNSIESLNSNSIMVEAHTVFQYFNTVRPQFNHSTLNPDLIMVEAYTVFQYFYSVRPWLNPSTLALTLSPTLTLTLVQKSLYSLNQTYNGAVQGKPLRTPPARPPPGFFSPLLGRRTEVAAGVAVVAVAAVEQMGVAYPCLGMDCNLTTVHIE